MGELEGPNRLTALHRFLLQMGQLQGGGAALGDMFGLPNPGDSDDEDDYMGEDDEDWEEEGEWVEDDSQAEGEEEEDSDEVSLHNT